MKKKILIFGILILAITLSGCVEPTPTTSGTVYKYVCSDGTMVDTAGLCPTDTGIDLDVVCADYCEETTSEPNTVEYLKAEMAAANYCEVVEDCRVADTKCPLGCYNLVNDAELDRINTLVDSFIQKCVQTCTSLTEMTCDEGKCMPVEVGTS